MGEDGFTTKKVKEDMKSTELERMKILFRNARAVGKKGRHFTDYMWMCE